MAVPNQSLSLANSFLNIIPQGLMVLELIGKEEDGQDFEIVHINELGKRLLRISSKEGPNNLSDFLLKKVKKKLFKDLNTILQDQGTIHNDFSLSDKKRKQWYEYDGTYYEGKILITFQEITAQVEQKQALKASEKKYRKLFEESMDPIFLMNNEHLFLEVNQAMTDFIGLDKSALNHYNLKDLFVNKQDYWEFNKLLYKQNLIEEFEASILLPSGARKACVINVVEVPEKKQKTSFYQGVIKDISKRRKAEEEMIIAEKLSMTGKIARSMAHEVRNPLTNLNLALEQLKDEFVDQKEGADLYFSIIERNAKRIEELLSKLLESSKPKALAFKPTQVNKVISKAVEIVADRIQLTQIKLIKHLKDDLPIIPLDSEQIEIALVNLLINAIEAMQTKGGQLEISSDLKEGHVCIQVKDNGPGISEGHLKQLFDPFFSAKQGGMGLGLTSVQNIIKSHNGDISVESETDKGTAFNLLFPI